MSRLNSHLLSYKSSRVDFSSAKMGENRQIAKHIMCGFANYLHTGPVRKSLPQKTGCSRQMGSGFEGLKVGEPNEFDAIITMNVKNSDRFNIVRADNLGPDLPHGDKAKEYCRIDVDPQGLITDKNARVHKWDPFLDTWKNKDGEPSQKPKHSKCLSPGKMSDLMKEKVDGYTKNLRMDNFDAPKKYPEEFLPKFPCREKSLSKIDSIKSSAKGDPNFTLNVTKKDGTKFDIDVTLAIEQGRGANKEHYIAKQHRRAKDTPNYEGLWLKTNPQREVNFVRKQRQEEKECMRTTKALVKHVIPDSYLVKTAWLNEIKGNPKRESFWKQDDYLEKGVRGILKTLEKSFETSEAWSSFNPNENVLSRYDEQYIQTTHRYLKDVNDRIDRGDLEGAMKKLHM